MTSLSFFEAYVVGGAAILGLMTVLWMVSLLLKNSSIVDIFWGAGFVFAVWVYFALTPGGSPPRKLALATVVTLWGLRLSFYILLRNWGHGEDFRYRKWRDEAGPAWWWRSFFKVFLLQGVLLWIISVALLSAQMGEGSDGLGALDFLALAVWTLGFVFETVGDWQLSSFKANIANRGRVLSTGLWRYTRHPNYFGDATQWWGYYLFAAAAGAWWAILSPMIMTFLLMRVSGVTLLEKALKDTKAGYREYVESTSAFFPWFPHGKR